MQQMQGNGYLEELQQQVNELDAKALDRMMRYAMLREDYRLMWAIAKADNTSEKTLIKLTNYEQVSIHVAVGCHRNSSERVLEYIANSPFCEARYEAAKNELTSVGCLRTLLDDPIAQVRDAAKRTLEQMGLI